MKTDLYTYMLIYATALGAFCALLIAGTGELTAPYRAANAKADKVRNILDVLDISREEEASPKKLLSVFDETVQRTELDGMIVYRIKTTGAMAVPFHGPGLWGPVKGFLALEPDGRTIRGITFHEQEETPGLGGEIASHWFREQFKGKNIVSQNGNPGIRIVGKKTDRQNEVHAISGATMTCSKVEIMLNKTIRRITGDEVNNG